MRQFAIDEGKPIPNAITESPILDEISVEYWNAFQILSVARGITSDGAPQALAFSEIDRYAIRFNLSDFDGFLAIIQEVDETYLALEAKDLKQRRKRGGKDSPNGASGRGVHARHR